VRAVDVIARKRDGGEHPAEEIAWLVNGVVSGEVADYQAAAWLMAVYLRGMSARETVDLTKAMAASGRTLDLGDLAPRKVDKHSTGGVGDKISLVAVPLAAAVGVVVPKMSGRGLGITGGTLDKLESIPGLGINLTEDEILGQVREMGLVIAGQTADLAPADGKLYALRDVTATVGSLPLIVSSILSKKLAGGAPAIVLDVKAGRGAFMPTVAAAEELARGLVETGRACGRRVVAYVSNMDQPLGRAVGNAVEVAEAIVTLKGDGPDDLQTLAITLASEMAQQAGVAADADDARRLIQDALTSGAALAKLRAMIAAQGGDARVIDDPGRLPTAPVVVAVTAPRDSYVADLDAGIVGQTLLALGAGRAKKTDPVDHRVGAIFHRKVGDRVTEGEPLFTLHLADEARLPDVREPILGAYGFSDDPVPSPRIVIRRIGES
jgi:pyrimidine-nucleoside phosphorylase